MDFAEAAVIDDPAYLGALGLPATGRLDGRTLWSRLIDRAPPGAAHLHAPLERILSGGTLASRLLHAAGDAPGQDRLRAIYRQLCDCLAAGRAFPAD